MRTDTACFVRLETPRRLLLGRRLGKLDRLAGQVHAQSVDPAVSAIDQPERMGIRHSGAVAETAKDIDGSHFFINHIGPVHNEHLSQWAGYLAGIPVLFF